MKLIVIKRMAYDFVMLLKWPFWIVTFPFWLIPFGFWAWYSNTASQIEWENKPKKEEGRGYF